jgi:putative aminopeptidase FrvX
MLALAVLLFAGYLHSKQLGDVNPKAIDTSIIRLLSNGSEYDGKLVRVQGVIRVEHEGMALYLTKEHADRSMTAYSVALSFTREQGEQLKKLGIRTGRYVQVEGIFENRAGGHFGINPCTIRDVTLVMPLAAH